VAQAGYVMLKEISFSCPYCGQDISVILDLSVRRQTYIEDCEVCCKPIEISYSVQDGDVDLFDAKVLE
jgi:transcription elongation factor Elf1